MKRRFSALAFTSLLLPYADDAFAQAQFTASEIVLGQWPETLYFEDMDGDSRKDLVIPQWQQSTGRELQIYLQQDNGRFPDRPSRLVEIKPEIIAIAFADVRDEPGQEILLIAANAVFSLSSAIPSYSANLQPLFDWDLVAAVPERREVHVLPPLEDFNGDGYKDLLLPGTSDYGIFLGGPEGEFSLSHRFNTVNESLDPSEIPLGSGRLNTDLSINERDGIVLRVTARGTSAFEEFVTGWEHNDQEELLRSRHWRPAAVSRQLNADSRPDIVYMNIGNDLYGQINILTQDDSGVFGAEPLWQGPIDTRGDIHLIEANDDAQTDIVRIVNRSNEWDVQFFLNKGGRFDLQAPDQVMKFSGYDLDVSVVDIFGDGQKQLSVSYYTIPVINAVRNASIVRSQLLFNHGSGSQVFNSRPDFKLDQNFSAETLRGLSAPMNLQADIDSNGRKDAVYVTDEGTLAAKSIDENLRIADTPFWQFVPQRSIMNFGVEDINGDGISDFFLRHSSALTVLVSQP